MSGILEICCLEDGISPAASKCADATPAENSSEVATVANSPEVGGYHDQRELLAEEPCANKPQDLLETLQCVLSRENVATDPSLALIMRKDPQACQSNAIGVEQLLEHPAIARIPGVTQEDLIEALPRMDPKLVRFDAEKKWAVPIMVKERDTLVLRLPTEAKEEDVRTLLEKAPIQGKIHITRQHNLPTVWYCELGSADIAREAALWLRDQEICGQKVQVGIKSEPAYATFLSRPVNPPPPPSSSNAMKAANGGRRAAGVSLHQGFRGGNVRGRGGNRRPPGSQQQAQQQQSQRNMGGRRGGIGKQHKGGVAAGAASTTSGNRQGAQSHRGEHVRQEGIGALNKQRLDMTADFPPLVEGGSRSRVSNGIGYGSESFHQYSAEFLREVKYKLDGVF